MMQYEAGLDGRQLHVMCLDFRRAGLDAMRATFLSRFVEFWCQANCSGGWHLEETDRSLHISFALDRDAILFKISSETYDYVYEHV